MSDMEKAVAIVTIGDLIVSRGIPAAIRLIQTLNAERATIDDLRALKDTGLQPAADYFEHSSEGREK